MEISVLTETQTYADFFRQSVLEDIPFWQGYLQNSNLDNAALQQKREQILKNIQFALDLETAWPSLLTLIETFSPYMERWGYWHQWQEILAYTLRVPHHLNDKTGQVKLLMLRARLLFRQNRLEESAQAYRQTIQLARQVGDSFTEARACSNLGYHFVEYGRWHRAEVLCCHALKLFEQLDSPHGRAHTENHLSILYTCQQQWAKAQQHLEQACAIWQAMGDDHGLFAGYQNLGLLHIDMGHYDQAVGYLEQARQLAELTGERAWVGIGYVNRGRICLLTGDLDGAESYYRQAEGILQKYFNFREMARVWNGLGLLYHRQDQRDEAHLYQEKALAVWRELKVGTGSGKLD